MSAVRVAAPRTTSALAGPLSDLGGLLTALVAWKTLLE